MAVGESAGRRAGPATAGAPGAPGRTTERPPEERREDRLLPVDALAAGYLLATAGVAAASGSPTGLALAALHLAAVAGIAAAAPRLPVPERSWAAFLRLAWPLLATPALYLELSVLNQLHFPGYFDAFVRGWEAALFGMQPSVEAGRRLTSLLLSETLHLGYFSYYFIVPAALVASMVFGGRAGLERTAFAVALAFLACYACFAVFPVAGPRYDYPAIDGPQAGGFFFALVHGVLEAGSSKGTAFPSSHVAAAVTAWLAAGRESRGVLRGLAPFAVALTLGTVYGRFHYAVDAAAGLAVALVCWRAAPWILARLGPAAGAGAAVDPAAPAAGQPARGGPGSNRV